MILDAVREARAHGARLARCSEVAGVDARTIERWERDPAGQDRRRGPKNSPHNRLSTAERKRIVAVATSPEYRDMSPKQMVPKLADIGVYIASESTYYRVLGAEELMVHRGRQKPRQDRSVTEHIANAPNQVWSWDITYLRSPVRGVFFYLYLMVDVWSRKVVGWRAEDRECTVMASELVQDAITSEHADPTALVLHQDNGGPMKGATLKATLETLGVLASYSRPRVSDDNPFSEALFRTLKYRPEYPNKPFESLEAARKWVAEFVRWYNEEHLHSAIGFVTPTSRHRGTDLAILENRRAVYEAARRRHPERWSRHVRKWDAPETVILNPSKPTKLSQPIATQAA